MCGGSSVCVCVCVCVQLSYLPVCVGYVAALLVCSYRTMMMMVKLALVVDSCTYSRYVLGHVVNFKRPFASN